MLGYFVHIYDLGLFTMQVINPKEICLEINQDYVWMYNNNGHQSGVICSYQITLIVNSVR